MQVENLRQRRLVDMTTGADGRIRGRICDSGRNDVERKQIHNEILVLPAEHLLLWGSTGPHRLNA